MATLWPKELPRHTDSEGEKKVYKALKSGLPKGWQAWHSLRIRSRKSGRFSETDFVIADPSKPSLLILEVKGGLIEASDGRWYQNGHSMDFSPLDQALSFRRLLVERFRDPNVGAPKIGCAVCFPDAIFEKGPLGDDLEGLVIGEKDLPYLMKVLPAVMAHAVPDPWPASNTWVHALHKLWGETWVSEICLGSRVQLDEEKRLRLDHEQMHIIECLSENDRLLIHGAAGTGKTLLACEAALREARQGRRVLFLCYTEALATFLSACLKGSTLTVGPVQNFASNLLGENASQKLMGRSSSYWEGVSLRAAVDGLSPEDERWDTVVVDEGQYFFGTVSSAILTFCLHFCTIWCHDIC
jgi:hypothetical protein